jgi:cytochrome P450
MPQLPPGPRGPRLLVGLRWALDSSGMTETATQTYGDIWSLRLMAGTTMVAVTHPELVESVFNADSTVIHKGAAQIIGQPILGKNSLVLLDEGEAMAMREVYKPPFASAHLARHSDAMAAICEEEISKWPLNEPLELLPRLDELGLNVIMSVIFGVRAGERQDALRARLRALFHWGDSPFRFLRMRLNARRGSPPPRSFLALRKPVDALLFEEIERARHDPDLTERDDVLATLVQVRDEAGNPMIDQTLRDTLMTLLIQGHATTATGAAWALERLMRHPDAYERLHAELQTDNEDYLNAVIKETLRVRPPAPTMVRQVVKPFRLREYELDPGSLVAVLIYQIHHRADLYPEPHRFRPERFLEQSPPPYAWIPFGGGERGCVGAAFATYEIKSVLRTLMRRARLVAAAPGDEAIRRRRNLYRPGRGARAVLTPVASAEADISAR